jgi:hypothetical protein
MPGPLTAFASSVVETLQTIRAMTEVSDDLERNIHAVIDSVTRLRQLAATLTGSADGELIKAMDKELSRVRRRLETFKTHAASGARGSQYLIDRDDLAEKIADVLDEAEHYFRTEVPRADPSALRDSSPSPVISVRIDRGNEGSSRYAS